MAWGEAPRHRPGDELLKGPSGSSPSARVAWRVLPTPHISARAEGANGKEQSEGTGCGTGRGRGGVLVSMAAVTEMP